MEEFVEIGELYLTAKQWLVILDLYQQMCFMMEQKFEV